MEDIVSFPTLHWTPSETDYQQSYVVPAIKVFRWSRMRDHSSIAVKVTFGDGQKIRCKSTLGGLSF